MTLATPNDYIQVSGKVEILVAFNLATNALVGATPATNALSYVYLRKLGESENGIRLRKDVKYGRVSGDRHGGSEGSPIESQFFGVEVGTQLTLSRYDPAVARLFDLYGGLTNYSNTAGTGNGTNGQPTEIVSGPGKVPLTAVGALMHRDRSCRFLFYSVRDPDQSINCPCVLWDRPHEIGKGTKYSQFEMGITGYRAPEGHWGLQVSGANIGGITDFVTGYVHNVDCTGIPSPYVPS